jgi:hypothetical protein
MAAITIVNAPNGKQTQSDFHSIQGFLGYPNLAIVPGDNSAQLDSLPQLEFGFSV